MRRLRATSALLDGEGIVYDHKGMPNFDYIHSKEYHREVSMIAFDLLELNGEDVRPQPLIQRKTWLEKLVSKVRDGIEFSEHLEGDGADIFRAACRLGHEGVIAKRKDLPYESGRSKRWLKIKNPHAPAAQRIEEGTL
jgi:bifunctional non-homologous end joining protein LigD